MAGILKTPMNVRPHTRVLLAVIFGVIVITSAFLWSQQSDMFHATGSLEATREEGADPRFSEDFDMNVLINPDWQKNLALENTPATNSSNTSSAATTLTERYADALLERLMTTRMSGDTTPVSAIVNQSIAEIDAATADQAFTMADIKTTKQVDMSRLKTYGNAVMQITLNYPSPYEAVGDELAIVEQAQQTGDEADLAPLDTHITYMQNILRDTIALEVPVIYQDDHLAIVNAYQAHLNNLIAMRQALSDPLLTIARLRYYEDSKTAIYNAYNDLYNKMYLNGVRWNSSDVASQFVQVNQ